MSGDISAAERMTAKYRGLMSRFIDGKISAQEFQSSYFQLFKSDDDQVSGREFKVLDKLFAEVDDYTADPELRERAGGIDGEELRTRAREAYEALWES